MNNEIDIQIVFNLCTRVVLPCFGVHSVQSIKNQKNIMKLKILFFRQAWSIDVVDHSGSL